jgi:hypothetical protein
VREDSCRGRRCVEHGDKAEPPALEPQPVLERRVDPEGLVWDGNAFQTPVTCLSFYHLEPIEGSVLAPPNDRWSSNPTNLVDLQRVEPRIAGGSKRWYRYGDSNPGPVAENHVS